jgi:hypothetical protein
MLRHAKNTPTRSFVKFVSISENESVTKVFITANMKNSKSHGKQEVDVQ